MFKNYFQSIAKEKLTFFLCLILLLLDRYQVLVNFNFQYVGNDDAIYWQAANDYSKGIFHEPYFYGQNYNLMVEAFFAIPLLKLGLPYNYALPLCTAILSLFPFILFSTILYRRKLHSIAIIFLAIPLCLPVEYGMICSMSRGFIQGLFFTSFFVFPLLEPNKRSSWIILAAALGASYVSNPNSFIVSFPVCIYLLYKNYKHFSFYWICSLALAPFLLFEYYAKEFYNVHKEFNVHGLIPIKFDFSQMLDGFTHLSDFFTFFTPVFWYKGWVILPIVFLMALFLIKKDKASALITILAVVFIYVTLGISKVNDSVNQLLLTSARMYLGIPIFAGISFLWAKPLFAQYEKKITTIVTVICCACFGLKSGMVEPATKRITFKKNYGCVSILHADSVKTECFRIKCMANYHQCDLVVFVPNWIVNTADMQIYTCSCNLLQKNFPANVIQDYEKRTWVYYEEKTKVRKNVMLYGHYMEEYKIKAIKNCTVICRNPYVLLFRNNTMRLDSLLKSVEKSYKRE